MLAFPLARRWTITTSPRLRLDGRRQQPALPLKISLVFSTRYRAIGRDGHEQNFATSPLPLRALLADRASPSLWGDDAGALELHPGLALRARAGSAER
jgi:hypothetical protein